MALKLDGDEMLVELDEQYKEWSQLVVDELNALKAAQPKETRNIIKQIGIHLKQCLLTVWHCTMPTSSIYDRCMNARS